MPPLRAGTVHWKEILWHEGRILYLTKDCSAEAPENGACSHHLQRNRRSFFPFCLRKLSHHYLRLVTIDSPDI